MGRSTFISAALHAAILLFALVAFSSAKVDQAPLAIPIDLAATPSDVTKLKAGERRRQGRCRACRQAQGAKAASGEGGRPLSRPTRPRRLPMPSPTSRRTISQSPTPRPRTKKAEPQKTADAKPKPAKPAPKKRDFSADKITAALLDKIPDAADEAKPVAPDDGAPPKKVKGQ